MIFRAICLQVGLAGADMHLQVAAAVLSFLTEDAETYAPFISEQFWNDGVLHLAEAYGIDVQMLPRFQTVVERCCGILEEDWSSIWR